MVQFEVKMLIAERSGIKWIMFVFCKKNEYQTKTKNQKESSSVVALSLD